jgi:hypothetical protein
MTGGSKTLGMTAGENKAVATVHSLHKVIACDDRRE